MNSERRYLYEKAEEILQTKSTWMGEPYLNSRFRKVVIDCGVGAGLLLPALGISSYSGLTVYKHDGHVPFVDVGFEIGGKHVPFWKIRTMVPNAQEHESEILKGRTLAEFKRTREPDPRVIKKVEWLRDRDLDEIPQVFHTLLGHWSAVGPRYPSVTDWDFLQENTHKEPYKQFVCHLEQGAKIGVTGMYFVLGRENLSLEDRFRLENMHWERASLSSDVRILSYTAKKLANGLRK